MATLISPGVSVTVTDESQYLPAATNTVPYLLIATAQDKVQGTGTAVAVGTLAANANKLYLVTSQRDLATVFGNPFFYKTTAGTPINGYELNEYGLLAAYSALGVSNRAYVQRVDIDLAALVGSLTRPVGTPADGVYWLDTENTRWGLFQFDQGTIETSTGGFELVTPTVITDPTQAPSGVPLSTLGTQGDYAVVASSVDNTVFYKAGLDLDGNNPLRDTWQAVGSGNWQKSWPTATSYSIDPQLGATGVLVINNRTIPVTDATTASGLATAINTGAGSTGVTANARSDLSVSLYAASNVMSGFDDNTGYVEVTGSGDVLTAVGLGDPGINYSPVGAASITVTAEVYTVTLTLSSATTISSGDTLGFQTSNLQLGGFVAASANTTIGTTTSTVTVNFTPDAGQSLNLGQLTSGYTSGDLVLTTVNGATISPTLQVLSASTPLTSGDITMLINSINLADPETPVLHNGNVYVDATGGMGGFANVTANVDGIYTSQEFPGAMNDNYLQLVTNATINPGLLALAAQGNSFTVADSPTAQIYPRKIYNVPQAVQQPHTQVPMWATTETPTGSLWNKTTSVNNGELINLRRYDSAQLAFVTQAVPVYTSDAAALKDLDPAGGGRNISAGASYALQNPNNNGIISAEILQRYATGPTIVTGQVANPVFNEDDVFYISVSQKGQAEMSTAVPCTVMGTNALAFVQAISSSGLRQVSATVTSDGRIQLTHSEGGVIQLWNEEEALPQINNAVQNAGFIPAAPDNGVPNIRFAPGSSNYTEPGVLLSNWVGSPTFEYTASASGPDQNPVDGTLWYYSTASQVDIMVNTPQGWRGYRTVSTDVRGFNLTNTDPNGPIISATRPVKQSDGTDLVPGDLWIDTSDLDNYPLLYRWEPVNGIPQWVRIDITDQTTQNGIIFADARWATSGAVDPVSDAIPTIVSLLTSNYLDPDAPDYTLYPTGALLFNTRRSGFNVKRFAADYFTSTAFPDEVLPSNPWTWVTASGNRPDGAAYLGRRAQRAMVVAAMRSSIDTAVAAREDANPFNVIACPGYPELIPNMVVLNNDRNQTSFIIGDTPLRLAADSQTLLSYATNTGDTLAPDALVTADPYVAVYYPQAQTNDTTGSTVVVPSSHMMLRTYIRNDQSSYPWFAPAGTRRGVVDNASALGYVDGTTGEFVQTRVGQAVRDLLYENNINPITFIPGVGITAYGQKTRYGQTSALDRVNVARLIVYLRQRLQQAVQNFLFEPNDAQTRAQVDNAVTSLLQDIVAKRGIYDYLVVCDETNNTPERIDRNELYVDIAIEPAKAVEFIYIPIRIRNTGAIGAAGSGVQG